MKLLMTILLSLWCVTAYADPTATIMALRGDVQIISQGNTQSVTTGDTLDVSDTVIVGAKSFATLQFIDGASLTLKPNSTLVIDEYQDQRAELNLVQGGIRMITGAWAKQKPEDYHLRTPVALMGVRGTEFSVVICDELCDNQ